MASITDIPPDLRDPTKADQLIPWLATYPIRREVRLALARIWERHTRGRLSPEQWAILNVT